MSEFPLTNLPATELRQSEIIGRLILDLDTTEEVGRVDQVLIDPKTHRLEGLMSRIGFLGRQALLIRWAHIDSIGQDSIVIHQTEDVQTLDDLNSGVGLEVWSDQGNRVGRIVDFCFNPQAGTILRYLFSSDGWQGLADGVYVLPPDAIVSAGRKRFMVKAAAVEAPEQYAEGISQQAEAVTNFLKRDYGQTQQDLQRTVQGVQSLAGDLSAKLRPWSKKARKALDQVSDQVQERGGQMQEQIQGRVDEFRLKSGQGNQPMPKADKTVDIDAAEIWGDEDEPNPNPESSPTPELADTPPTPNPPEFP
jgi:uncharacterized protein YrrD